MKRYCISNKHVYSLKESLTFIKLSLKFLTFRFLPAYYYLIVKIKKSETEVGSNGIKVEWPSRKWEIIILTSFFQLLNFTLLLPNSFFLLLTAHFSLFLSTLRKHAYSNILKSLPPKNENFQIKILIFFIILLKT